MVDQLLDVAAVCRVFPEAFIEEISSFPGDEYVGRDADLIFDNLDEFFFFGDFEGVFSD